MATGTGKPRTAVAFVKRLFEASVVTRVLFLVDRIALAAQAEDAFTDHLPDDSLPRVAPRAKNERLETGPTKRNRLHSLPPTISLPQNPGCSPLTLIFK